MVAVCAVRRSLTGVGEKTARKGGIGNAFRDMFVDGKRFTGFAILDEFEPDQEAQSANITDDRVICLDGFELLEEIGADTSGVVDQFVVEDVVALGG